MNIRTGASRLSRSLGRLAFTTVVATASLALSAYASAETLVVGQVAELSGQEVVAENVAGARLWLDHVNASAREPNKFVLKQYDDKRDPKLTVSLTHKLVDEDKAIALF